MAMTYVYLVQYTFTYYQGIGHGSAEMNVNQSITTAQEKAELAQIIGRNHRETKGFDINNVQITTLHLLRVQ